MPDAPSAALPEFSAPSPTAPGAVTGGYSAPTPPTPGAATAEHSPGSPTAPGAAAPEYSAPSPSAPEAATAEHSPGSPTDPGAGVAEHSPASPTAPGAASPEYSAPTPPTPGAATAEHSPASPGTPSAVVTIPPAGIATPAEQAALMVYFGGNSGPYVVSLTVSGPGLAPVTYTSDSSVTPETMVDLASQIAADASNRGVTADNISLPGGSLPFSFVTLRAVAGGPYDGLAGNALEADWAVVSGDAGWLAPGPANLTGGEDAVPGVSAPEPIIG